MTVAATAYSCSGKARSVALVPDPARLYLYEDGEDDTNDQVPRGKQPMHAQSAKPAVKLPLFSWWFSTARHSLQGALPWKISQQTIFRADLNHDHILYRP